MKTRANVDDLPRGSIRETAEAESLSRRQAMGWQSGGVMPRNGALSRCGTWEVSRTLTEDHRDGGPADGGQQGGHGGLGDLGADVVHQVAAGSTSS